VSEIESKQFIAKLDQLYPMLDFVRAAIHKIGFEANEAQRFEIAVEETLVNIIHHAYPQSGSNKKGTIELTLKLYPKEKMQVVVKDQGVAFNPLNQDASIDYDASLEERQVGGLGIPFMREFVDQILYEREDLYNILILEKSLVS